MANTKNGYVMYAVNDISFHPVHGTFVTCGEYITERPHGRVLNQASLGSDGGITSWDGDARIRIKRECSSVLAVYYSTAQCTPFT